MNTIELNRYEELVEAKNDACNELTEKTILLDKAKDKIDDLQRTIGVLRKTCKAHNDFVDDNGLRDTFQRYFDEDWIKREENK